VGLVRGDEAIEIVGDNGDSDQNEDKAVYLGGEG
jgi:hypothetical protein